MKRLFTFVFAAVLAALSAPAPTFADFMYDEAINGDLSNNRREPTVLVADPGANTLRGMTRNNMGTVDLDYFTVVIPVGFQLDSLFQTSYMGDGTSFIAVQSGTEFTTPPDFPDISTLLGWLHFGDNYRGLDILPLMAMEFGVIGYTPPLPSGSYTFWVQETSSIEAKYTFTFNLSPQGVVIPEPSSLTLAALGALWGLTYARRRWRR